MEEVIPADGIDGRHSSSAKRHEGLKGSMRGDEMIEIQDGGKVSNRLAKQLWLPRLFIKSI